MDHGGKMCRCLGKMARRGSKKVFKLMSIKQTALDDVEHVASIVTQGGRPFADRSCFAFCFAIDGRAEQVQTVRPTAIKAIIDACGVCFSSHSVPFPLFPLSNSSRLFPTISVPSTPLVHPEEVFNEPPSSSPLPPAAFPSCKPHAGWDYDSSMFRDPIFSRDAV